MRPTVADPMPMRLRRWTGSAAGASPALAPLPVLADAVSLQSVVDPASPEAAAIDGLWDAMLMAAVAIFVAVMLALLLAALRGRGQTPRPLGEDDSRRLVLAGGVIIPVIVLFALVAGSVRVGSVASTPSMEGDLTIEVIGRRWWWEVRYLGQNGEPLLVTANEIHVPAGEPVRFLLRSTNVIHSFWVPNLQGKKDMIPGITNVTAWTAAQPGRYRGQCAEFCGIQHAWMAFEVEAHAPSAFQAWLSRQQGPARPPTTPEQLHGRQVFRESCSACHAVREANLPWSFAMAGPDLTHVASRAALGAGAIPNTRGHLAGWIVNSQSIKPGNLMPPQSLEPQDLHALLAYLQSLD